MCGSNTLAMPVSICNGTHPLLLKVHKGHINPFVLCTADPVSLDGIPTCGNSFEAPFVSVGSCEMSFLTATMR